MPPRRAWSCSPGISRRESPWGRQDLLRSWGTPIVLLPCSPTPAGPPHQATAMPQRGPRSDHNEGSRNVSFGAQSHGFSTCCLRFAATGCPASTQDSLPAAGQLYRTGLITRRVPSKGFEVYPTSHPPFPSFRSKVRSHLDVSSLASRFGTVRCHIYRLIGSAPPASLPPACGALPHRVHFARQPAGLTARQGPVLIPGCGVLEKDDDWQKRGP